MIYGIPAPGTFTLALSRHDIDLLCDGKLIKLELDQYAVTLAVVAETDDHDLASSLHRAMRALSSDESLIIAGMGRLREAMTDGCNPVKLSAAYSELAAALKVTT